MDVLAGGYDRNLFEKIPKCANSYSWRTTTTRTGTEREQVRRARTSSLAETACLSLGRGCPYLGAVQ